MAVVAELAEVSGFWCLMVEKILDSFELVRDGTLVVRWRESTRSAHYCATGGSSGIRILVCEKVWVSQKLVKFGG